MKAQIEITPLKEGLLACRAMVRYVLIFGIILNLLMLTTPIYSMQVLDRVLSSSNTDTLLMLTLVIMLALVLQGLLQAARSFATNRMGSWFENRLSEIVFTNAIKSSLDSKANANSQQLRDLQTIKTYITSPGLTAIMDTPWAIIFIIVLFMLHVWIGSLAVIGGAILILVGIIADRSTKNLLESNNDNFVRSMKYVDQATRNAEVIEVMGLRKNLIASWQKLNSKVQNTQALSTDRQSVFTEITKLIRTIIQIAVTGLGAYLVIKNEFSSGAIIASSSLVGRALAPFEVAITSWKGYINCRKSYDRLNASFVKGHGSDDVMELPAPEGRLSIENVFYAPPGTQKHIVKGVSFAIEAGETLAIIGHSGSGKTTLAKIMVGIWQPSIGTVRVDGASLRDWNRHQLGQYVGYLPQDVELFGGTIKENIGRMDPNANAEDIVMAAQLAGVHDVILQLPKAYDTEIGIDGSFLSGGQRQRVGLARAFFGIPRLIVLDEPNSSLDAAGEAALATAVEVAKEQKVTTIIISHRNSILGLADKLLVMRDGMMVAFGPRDEVLKQMNTNTTANPVAQS